jgi:hypothetical protein
MVRHRLTDTVAADADWYGRSTAAGSLMVWTHNRKEMVWHDAYTPAECSGGGDEAVPAVSVESGVQFFDLCECLVNACPLAWVELPDDWVLFERLPLLYLSLSLLCLYIPGWLIEGRVCGRERPRVCVVRHVHHSV